MLDPTLVRSFANAVTGNNQSYGIPGGPAGQGLVLRIGKVQSLDTTNSVALCTIAGGTTKVAVAVLNGNFPPVNAIVGILIYGQSYYLLGSLSSLATNVATGLSYSSGWSNYGGGFPNGVWWLDAIGKVELQGEIAYSGTPLTVNSFVTFATLPTAARPPNTKRLNIFANAGTAVYPTFVDVHTDGTMQLYVTTAWTLLTLSLTGYSFSLTL